MDGMTLPPADWRQRPGLTELARVLGAEEGESRYVGGAVRDSLLGLPVADIDIATRLTAEAVVQRCKSAGIRVVPTGLRRRLTFDTLSTGESLAKIGYALVGGHVADQLRGWAFRKFVTLDPATWGCKPGFDGDAARLPVALLAAPAWAALPAADREAVYQAGEVLATLDLDRFDALRADTDPADIRGASHVLEDPGSV